MPVWYHDKKDLKNSPSTQSGISYEDEIRYRREGARFIQELGKHLGLRHDTMATASIYFHRFYLFHSFLNFPRYVTATCALFLAGKAEETPKKCRDIIKNVKELLNASQFNTFGQDPREEVMTLERVLLQTIKFDLQVDHPYASILKYAKILKGDKQKLQRMVQMSWTFVNDSLCTTLCLQWEPEVIAIALMYLAAKLSKFEIKDWQNRTSDHKEWWDQFVKNLTTPILDDICHQVLDLYTTPAKSAKECPPSPPPGSRPPPVQPKPQPSSTHHQSSQPQQQATPQASKPMQKSHYQKSGSNSSSNSSASGNSAPHPTPPANSSAPPPSSGSAAKPPPPKPPAPPTAPPPVAAPPQQPPALPPSGAPPMPAMNAANPPGSIPGSAAGTVQYASYAHAHHQINMHSSQAQALYQTGFAYQARPGVPAYSSGAAPPPHHPPPHLPPNMSAPPPSGYLPPGAPPTRTPKVPPVGHPTTQPPPSHADFRRLPPPGSGAPSPMQLRNLPPDLRGPPPDLRGPPPSSGHHSRSATPSKDGGGPGGVPGSRMHPGLSPAGRPPPAGPPPIPPMGGSGGGPPPPSHLHRGGGGVPGSRARSPAVGHPPPPHHGTGGGGHPSYAQVARHGAGGGGGGKVQTPTHHTNRASPYQRPPPNQQRTPHRGGGGGGQRWNH